MVIELGGSVFEITHDLVGDLFRAKNAVVTDASQGALIMSQCSSNPCALRETQKPHVHAFGFDPVSNPVAPVLGDRRHRFCVSRPNV
jgi:hypothetical protein